MDLHLDIDAPRSDEYTLTVAQGMAEAVRVLNHATYSLAATSQPSTIYGVLGSIEATLTGIPQLLSQLSRLLVQLGADDRLYDDRDRDDAELASHTVTVIKEALLDRRIRDAVRESSHLGLLDQPRGDA
jgi:hypothetical protein